MESYINGLTYVGTNLEDRVQQLLAVAFDGTDIVSIGTAEVKEIPDIGETFYCYRNFVSLAARMREIGTRISIQAFLAMEARNRDLASPEAVGFYMEIENPQLMKIRNEAIWLDTRFLFRALSCPAWDGQERGRGSAARVERGGTAVRGANGRTTSPGTAGIFSLTLHDPLALVHPRWRIRSTHTVSVFGQRRSGQRAPVSRRS